MVSKSIIFALFIATAFLAGEAGAATCLSGGCHAVLTATKYLHGPVAAEMAGAKGCVACHVPAGAQCTASKKGSFKPLAPGEKMCQICHGRGTGTQHSINNINCLKCHDPHGSDKDVELHR